MDVTLFLTKFYGLLFLVGGTALWSQRDMAMKAMKEISKQPWVIFIAGFITLLMGLMAVLFHNEWTSGLPLLITVLSWLILVKAILRLFAPEWVAKMAKCFAASNWYNFSVLVMVALGLYLSYVGFWM